MILWPQTTTTLLVILIRLPNLVEASSQNITTRIVHLKPKYIIKNNSQFIITVIQDNRQKPSREIVLSKDEISPLFSNDGKLDSPVVRFRVKNHGWSDKIILEKPMLIFIALIKKRQETDSENMNMIVASDRAVMTEIEKSSGFKVE